MVFFCTTGDVELSDEIIRRLELDVAEHALRIQTLENLLRAQNDSLTKLSEQLAKLQSRLTTIGSAAVAVIAVSSESGGQFIRALIGA